jgi:hypothetical protein
MYPKHGSTGNDNWRGYIPNSGVSPISNHRILPCSTDIQTINKTGTNICFFNSKNQAIVDLKRTVKIRKHLLRFVPLQPKLGNLGVIFERSKEILWIPFA